MSPLAVRIGVGVLALLALIALRGKRWAYLALVVLGLLYFPAQAHFRVHVPKCELLLPTMQQLLILLHNYAYIGLFAAFYWISWVQFRDADARGITALVVTLLACALLEIAEGMNGVGRAAGHCRVRDLVPDVAGAVGAALLFAIWSRLSRKPAYVRLGRPRAAAAPLPVAPPSRPVVPPRGVPLQYPPPPVPPPRVVPPPPDFSPGPSPITAPSSGAPTEEVARSEAGAARTALVQRLKAILGTILGRVQTILQRIWVVIRGRRRATVVGLVLLLVGGAAALVILRRPAPTSVATAQPKDSTVTTAPPPPPPKPLQSQVEGYYEPSYQFTVWDRRFTRLTLRPEPFVRFSRLGTRQDAGCTEARISPVAVHLRCELEPYGTVTIDGRFASRYTTSQLDKPVLSALITVTNPRGETLYRARDSFLWHQPD